MKDDPEASLKQLKSIELNQDIHEAKSFHRQAKRPKVKEALEALVKSFEGNLADMAIPGGSVKD